MKRFYREGAIWEVFLKTEGIAKVKSKEIWK